VPPVPIGAGPQVSFAIEPASGEVKQ
jgi:hypothetical protein